MLIISEWPMRAQDMFWVANQVAGSEGECKSSVIRFGFRGSNQTSQLPNRGLQTTYTLRANTPAKPSSYKNTHQHKLLLCTILYKPLTQTTIYTWKQADCEIAAYSMVFKLGAVKGCLCSVGVLGENIREKKDFAKCAFFKVVKDIMLTLDIKYIFLQIKDIRGIFFCKMHILSLSMITYVNFRY